MVEHHIYPIMPGSIVITRPYEYHHCIYHSDELHKHFWILFSASGNEMLFERFFNRPLGENNLLILPPEKQKELVSVCNSMIDCKDNQATQYYNFFNLICLLEQASVDERATHGYPAELSEIIEYIDSYFSERISVEELARLSHVSINTLERHFAKALGLSPTEYIKKKRMAYAAIMLSEERSVTDACLASGFSDYSGFISAFKKYYGLTPLQYGKKAMPPKITKA